MGESGGKQVAQFLFLGSERKPLSRADIEGFKFRNGALGRGRFFPRSFAVFGVGQKLIASKMLGI